MAESDRKAGGWVEGHFSEEYALKVERNRPAIERVMCVESKDVDAKRERDARCCVNYLIQDVECVAELGLMNGTD